MNILYLSPYVPSIHAYHAGGVLMGKEIETLKQKHNVYIVSYINNEKDEQLTKEFETENATFFKLSKWEKIIRVLLHPFTPNMFAIRIDRKLEKKIRELIKEKRIDVIHADYTAMGYYTKLKKVFPGLRFNIVEHDIVQQSYARQVEHAKGLHKAYYRWQFQLVKNKEVKYCKAADAIFVLNVKDNRLLSDYYGLKDNVYTINPYYGVDIEAQQDYTVYDDEKESNSICFVGQMGRAENKKAALRLINIFQSLELQNKKLYIIGANPDNELLEFNKGNIVITGFVDDINSVILKCKIGVFPLEEGAGIKFKVLLALALGLPVITTVVGAEGIDEDGKVIDLAETDHEIKEYIMRLLTDNAYYEDKRDKATAYVCGHFGWKITEEVFDKIYSDK